MRQRTLRSLLALVTVLAVVALVSACGTDRTADPAPSEEPPASTSPPTPARSTTPPSEGEQKIRVVGEVTRTGHCVVVRDDNSITWTLTGEQTKDLEVGDRVQVTGAPDLGVTGCGGPLVRTISLTVISAATATPNGTRAGSPRPPTLAVSLIR